MYLCCYFHLPFKEIARTFLVGLVFSTENLAYDGGNEILHVLLLMRNENIMVVTCNMIIVNENAGGVEDLRTS